jgi:phage/conjugal plasmid C-4 type zinc finger TraR family protein
VSDFADKAQEREEIFQAESRFLQAQKSARPAESAFVCADCETEIPEARRIAARGCSLCIDCQEFHDKLKRLPRT